MLFVRVKLHDKFKLQTRPREFKLDVRCGEGISWESNGELASFGLRPKMGSTKQVQHEELVNIEDGMEKVFYTSNVYDGIIHKWVQFLEKLLFILCKERLDDDQER